MLLNEIRIVSEYSDSWWRGLDLRGVIQFDLAPCGLGRLSAANDFLERGIHLRGADPLVPLGVHFKYELEDLRHALSAQRRSEDERYELQKWRFLLRLFLERGRGVVLFLLEIPLVHDEDQAATILPG